VHPWHALHPPVAYSAQLAQFVYEGEPAQRPAPGVPAVQPSQAAQDPYWEAHAWQVLL
jgi:hypothetical protein